MEPDRHDLRRFLLAQEPVWAQVLSELTQGRKQSHWMWFVFPQIEGLGSSAMARRYALSGLDEARAYVAHEVLGPRLLHCTALTNAIPGKSIGAIFGHPDELKFKSCMTLFAQAAPHHVVFGQALRRYFAGNADPLTLARLQGH